MSKTICFCSVSLLHKRTPLCNSILNREISESVQTCALPMLSSLNIVACIMSCRSFEVIEKKVLLVCKTECQLIFACFWLLIFCMLIKDDILDGCFPHQSGFKFHCQSLWWHNQYSCLLKDMKLYAVFLMLQWDYNLLHKCLRVVGKEWKDWLGRCHYFQRKYCWSNRVSLICWSNDFLPFVKVEMTLPQLCQPSMIQIFSIDMWLKALEV